MGQLQRSELGEVRSSVLDVFNLSSLFVVRYANLEPRWKLVGRYTFGSLPMDGS